MKRDWMIKLDNGEYLREWRGFSPFWIGCFYGDSIMLGGEEEFKNCYDFFSGIGDVEWWIASEIEKLTEEQKDRMYSLMVRNREVRDWIDSKRSSIKEMCDTMGIGTEYVYRLGNKLIKQVLESEDFISEYKSLLLNEDILKRVTSGENGQKVLMGAGVIKKGIDYNDYENMKREIVESTQEDLKDLWNGVYFEGNSHELYGETYTHIDKINTSHLSDGPSWDYIVQRKSDGKYFKFNVWDAGDRNGYIIEDEYLEEVFPVEENKVSYK